MGAARENPSSRESEPTRGRSAESRSARRRHAIAIRDLAWRLVELPAGARKELLLDADLNGAVERGAAFRAHGARKRQVQTIARLLRDDERQDVVSRLTGQLRA
jgi:ribosomal 50S subunit-associated protein YjgA (DUF615 family)